MTFTVTYRAKDGALREERVEAASRAGHFGRQPLSRRLQRREPCRRAAYRALLKVQEPGLRSAALWGAAILAAVAVGVWWWTARAGRAPYLGGSEVQATGREAKATSFLTAQTRRQVIGDVAVIEKGIRTGWADAFEREGDRFFASFAIPGAEAGKGDSVRA